MNASPTIPHDVTLDVGTFHWSPETGLDPAVVATVAPWILQAARQLRYPAAKVGLSEADLVQEGTVGALLAARRFDPTYTKWLAYAKKRISGAMFRALGRGEVAIPDNQVQSLRKSGNLPPVTSLDAPAAETGTCLVDLLNTRETQAEDAIASRRHLDLWKALESLDSRERSILIQHHGLQGDARPLERIAADMGLSGAGVQRIERIARMHLRAALSRLGVTC